MTYQTQSNSLFRTHLLSMWMVALIATFGILSYLLITLQSLFFVYIGAFLFIIPIYGIMAAYTVISLGGRWLSRSIKMVDHYNSIWSGRSAVSWMSPFWTHLVVWWMATLTLASGVALYLLITGEIQYYFSVYNPFILIPAVGYTVISVAAKYLWQWMRALSNF